MIWLAVGALVLSVLAVILAFAAAAGTREALKVAEKCADTVIAITKARQAQLEFNDSTMRLDRLRAATDQQRDKLLFDTRRRLLELERHSGGIGKVDFTKL